jgi:hypothetical protein
MNLLVDEFPNAVEISGVVVSINPGFRNCLRTILAFEDDALTVEEKATVLLMNLYPAIPENTEEAFKQGIKFLNGGRDTDGEVTESPMRLYSFSKDAGFIFSAFRQTHGIDLETEELHWWKFLALFMDLGADTVFCSLTGLRKRLKTNKATKEERAAAAEMGDLIDVPEPDLTPPDVRSADEEFMKLLGSKR